MMKDIMVPKKILKGYIEGRRPVERPRGIWIGAVHKDPKSMSECKRCTRSVENGDAWRRRIDEIKAQIGL
jgi:hypothetical protein